ncbi:MAG: putative isochorismatase domain [Actinomycetota bacterium]|jgi:nicotinamidase-related amidase
MAIDLTPYLEPSATAIVALEVQEHILRPAQAIIPGVAAHADAIGLVDRLATLLHVARRVGAPVVYVVDDRRSDGYGGAGNMRVGRSIRGDSTVTDAAVLPSHGPIVAELRPHDRDILIRREHGMTGFFTTPLDAYLRNLGVTSVVLTGASANIAVTGTAIEAMNLGYQVIVVSDCIAGDPPEYVEQLLRYTLRNVAFVAPAQRILDHWSALPDVPPGG